MAARQVLRSPVGRQVGPVAPLTALPVQRRGEQGSDRELRIGGRDIYKQLVAELKNASDRALIAANRYASQVDDAAGAFKTHASAHLERLEGQVTGGDLFGLLLAAFPPTLPYAVAGRTSVKFLDDFATGLASTAESRLRAGLQDAADFGSSEEDLKKTVELLPTKAENIGSALPTVVHERFDKPVAEIMDKDPGQWSADEGRFVQPFVMAVHQSSSGQIDPPEMDRIIEEQIGLPTPGRAIDFQVELFRGWVEVFERQLVAAEASAGSHIEDIVSERQGGGSPHRRVAAGRARKAARHRRRELESSR